MLQVLKLTTGDEIVGDVIKKNIKNVIVNNPLTITHIQSRFGGNPAVFLKRFIPFTSQEDVTIPNSQVICIVDPIQGLQEYYDNVLDNIKVNIDTNIVANLLDAAEATPVINNKSDLYRAILEDMDSKGHKH